MQAYETWQTFGGFVTKHKPKIGPGVRERMEFANRHQDACRRGAQRADQGARAHPADRRSRHDPASPTAPSIAPKVEISGAELEEFRVRVMRLTCTSGVSGLPQMSIPAGTVSGCPIGLSFIGWAGGDEALLDLACELARHCGMAA